MSAINSQTQYSAPNRLFTSLEGRAVGEFMMMLAARPVLDRLPRGDGHPVLVLPGFTASDRSTAPLRSLLDRLGYRTYEWGLGLNVGPTPTITQGIMNLLDRISQVEDESVSIIGWSLGGIYARELARLDPAAVHQVITMGSPIQMLSSDRSASSDTWESMSHMHDTSMLQTERDHERTALKVPATSIYTRTDGVVDWRSCLIEKGSASENVEVYGSHCGLGFNPAVAFVLADRLAQPVGEWRAFHAPVALRGLFPRAANLRTSRVRAA